MMQRLPFLYILLLMSMQSVRLSFGFFSSQASQRSHCRVRRNEISRLLQSTAREHETTSSDGIKNVGIVGGGLAGLSTAYHLLQRQPSLHITILDTTKGPGQGGASAVAGG